MLLKPLRKNILKLKPLLSLWTSIRMSSASVAQHIIDTYQAIFDLDKSKIPEIGKSIPIPQFPEKDLMELSDNVLTILRQSPIVVHVESPIYIVGDIHGNIFDLLRIIVLARPPPTSRYLFLGDYVDRGQYSIEVVTLLFALLTIYPDNITVLRGNHEFDSINYTYGFYAEVQQQFHSDNIFNHFNDAFAWLPLVATVNDQFFCVHGGISPELESIQQIERIRRPLNSFDIEFVSNLLWSDPSADTKSSGKSGRGVGVTFGIKALDTFLDKFKMKAVFRAHQCVQMGVSKFAGNKLYTVFSCSNYDEGIQNSCGLVFIGMYLDIQLFSLPPIDVIGRASASTKMDPFVPLKVVPKVRSSLTILPQLKVSCGICHRCSYTSLSLYSPSLQERLPVILPIQRPIQW